MLYRRGGDRRMKWSIHKSLWWVSYSEDAFLNFALMGLVSLPIIIWAIIFLLIISRNELALLHSEDRNFFAWRVASAEAPEEPCLPDFATRSRRLGHERAVSNSAAPGA